MLKSIKKYSLVALAALVLIGCGANDNNDKAKIVVENNGKAATIEALRSLGEETDRENLSNSKIRSSTEGFSDSYEDDSFGQMCQSGTMDFDAKDSQQLFSFDANNCNDGESTIDGSASVQMYKNDNGMLAKVLKDLTINDDYFSLFAKEGSFIEIKTSGENITVETGFELSINGEKLSASNLKVVASQSENGGSFYIASGEMLIDEFYFKVDPSYNASSTKIIMNDDGFESNGVIKLLDGAGNRVEIAVVSPYELALKIDENGDGVFSEAETLTENIEDLFDFADDAVEEQSAEPAKTVISDGKQQ